MANRMYQQQMDFQNQNGNSFSPGTGNYGNGNGNPMQQFGQMQQNPMGFLASRGLNIPPQYANDPKGAVQYLLTNGRMNQGMLNNLMQRAQMMGFKF